MQPSVQYINHEDREGSEELFFVFCDVFVTFVVNERVGRNCLLQ
jgi:hypothetical protein